MNTIDVLSAMEGNIAAMSNARLYCDDLIAARAAVADLIAAAERSLNWLSSYPGNGAIGAYDQMRKALAACTTTPPLSVGDREEG